MIMSLQPMKPVQFGNSLKIAFAHSGQLKLHGRAGGTDDMVWIPQDRQRRLSPNQSAVLPSGRSTGLVGQSAKAEEKTRLEAGNYRSRNWLERMVRHRLGTGKKRSTVNQFCSKKEGTACGMALDALANWSAGRHDWKLDIVEPAGTER